MAETKKEADSLVWAREFLKKNKRLPNAVDYSEAGFTGGQCDCLNVGSCCLVDHPQMTVTTDRQCYANQLRDFINLTNE